jgi:outer membrane lipoprotein SlyB
MKKIMVVTVLLSLAGLPLVEAQQKTLASTMEIYVFPNKGQAADQQSQDEAECYNWAVNQTGSDPFDLSKQSQQTQAQTEQAKKDVKGSSRGSGAGGAVGGAAAGAVIGSIVSDDAGKGAAYGAAAGLIGGRRRGKSKEKSAQKSIEQQGQQQQQQIAGQMDNFKKAFSVCLESKEYMVKY